MEFGWDPGKDARTRLDRGFGFADVVTLFDGRDLLLTSDLRRDYGEQRVKALGIVGGGCVAVIFTDRGSLRWIISARVASRKERQAWHARFG